MRLLCWIGIHRTRFIHPENDTHVLWAVVGQDYKEECTRCGRQTEVFTLTREMLP